MERLDIVTDDDRVIGSATKGEIYRRLLTHRIVHVLVFNARGDLLLQKRSKTVGFCPLYWSSSVGGHVMSGETYEQAGLREAQEEIGVVLELYKKFTDRYWDPRGLSKILTTFTAVHEGPFRMEPNDVDELVFVPLPRIWSMVRGGEPFHPELLFLLNKHYSL